jgi:hypothetical protein
LSCLGAFDTETLSSTITLNWYTVHSRQLLNTNSSDPIPTISLAQRFFFPMHPDTTSQWKPIAKLKLQFYSRQLLQRIQATNSNNLIGLKVFPSQLKRYMPKYSKVLHTSVYSYTLYYNSWVYVNTLGLTSVPW